MFQILGHISHKHMGDLMGNTPSSPIVYSRSFRFLFPPIFFVLFSFSIFSFSFVRLSFFHFFSLLIYFLDLIPPSLFLYLYFSCCSIEREIETENKENIDRYLEGNCGDPSLPLILACKRFFFSFFLLFSPSFRLTSSLSFSFSGKRRNG